MEKNFIKCFASTFVTLLLLISCDQTGNDNQEVKEMTTDTTYFPDGSIHYIERFIDDTVRHGVTIVFYENNNQRYQARFDEGEIVGNTFKYYPNGNIKEVLTYDNGDPVFRKKYFESDSGVVNSEFFIENLKPNGIVKRYWRNGNVKAKIEYQDGKRNGKFVLNTKEGAPKDTLYFDNDEQID